MNQGFGIDGALIILMGFIGLVRSWKLINYFREFEGKGDIGLWKSWKELAEMKPMNAMVLYMYIVPIRKKENESSTAASKRKAVNITTVGIYILTIILAIVLLKNK